MANRLATESSPYLRQHADNPVDWYPWGPEAFAAAVAQDKPVLLSIGYAACHWCHVMAHESFEDDETAAVMNQLFINVKVDREERPDVDALYMQAVQAMTGHGGWPLTVALTPAGEPYWGGTYFPREERPGIPAFRRVLETIATAWHARRDAVVRTTTAMRDLLEQQARPGVATGPLTEATLTQAMDTLARRFDPIHGGFDGAPKFPQAMSLAFCLDWHTRTGDPTALLLAHRSFLGMVRGGLFDQVGGGFHRYTVDAAWLIPHFEKMLYDNALLVQLGVQLWRVTGDPEVRRATEATLEWVAREMTAPEGGFYASYDADSEGEEGRFYLWDPASLRDVLGEDADLAMTYWGVTPGGNFEGRSILHVPVDPATVATRVGLTPEVLQTRVAQMAARLYAHRRTRIWPGLDDKVLAAWNGLMCRALAAAAMAFDDPRWKALALQNGAFLRSRLVQDGRVTRVFAAGVAKGPGFLEDHAAVSLAFQALHQLTGDATWQAEGDRIAAVMAARFQDPTTGAWYDTAVDGEALLVRPRDVYDNATPAGGSLAMEVELAWAARTGDAARHAAVGAQLAALAEPMRRWPNGFGHALGVALRALPPQATEAPASGGSAGRGLQADPSLQALTSPGLACGPDGCAPLPPSVGETPTT